MDEETHEPLLPVITLIVATAVKLRKDGHKVVIVSSGAIGVGLQRMDMDRRPKQLAKLQASSCLPAGHSGGRRHICRRLAASPPRRLHLLLTHGSLQALAAIGQCRLMSLWDSLFTHYRQPIAQILLTRNDIAEVSPAGFF